MPLFASGDTDWFFWIIAAIFVIVAISKAAAKAAKEKEEADLRRQHPELWAKMEHEKQVMEHEKQIMRHQNVKTGIGLGAFFLRLFMKD